MPSLPSMYTEGVFPHLEYLINLLRSFSEQAAQEEKPLANRVLEIVFAQHQKLEEDHQRDQRIGFISRPKTKLARFSRELQLVDEIYPQLVELDKQGRQEAKPLIAIFRTARGSLLQSMMPELKIKIPTLYPLLDALNLEIEELGKGKPLDNIDYLEPLFAWRQAFESMLALDTYSNPVLKMQPTPYQILQQQANFLQQQAVPRLQNVLEAGYDFARPILEKIRLTQAKVEGEQLAFHESLPPSHFKYVSEAIRQFKEAAKAPVGLPQDALRVTLFLYGGLYQTEYGFTPLNKPDWSQMPPQEMFQREEVIIQGMLNGLAKMDEDNPFVETAVDILMKTRQALLKDYVELEKGNPESPYRIYMLSLEHLENQLTVKTKLTQEAQDVFTLLYDGLLGLRRVDNRVRLLSEAEPTRPLRERVMIQEALKLSDHILPGLQKLSEEGNMVARAFIPVVEQMWKGRFDLVFRAISTNKTHPNVPLVQLLKTIRKAAPENASANSAYRQLVAEVLTWALYTPAGEATSDTSANDLPAIEQLGKNLFHIADQIVPNSRKKAKDPQALAALEPTYQAINKVQAKGLIKLLEQCFNYINQYRTIADEDVITNLNTVYQLATKAFALQPKDYADSQWLNLLADIVIHFRTPGVDNYNAAHLRVDLALKRLLTLANNNHPEAVNLLLQRIIPSLQTAEPIRPGEELTAKAYDIRIRRMRREQDEVLDPILNCLKGLDVQQYPQVASAMQQVEAMTNEMMAQSLTESVDSYPQADNEGMQDHLLSNAIIALRKIADTTSEQTPTELIQAHLNNIRTILNQHVINRPIYQAYRHSESSVIETAINTLLKLHSKKIPLAATFLIENQDLLETVLERYSKARIPDDCGKSILAFIHKLYPQIADKLHYAFNREDFYPRLVERFQSEQDPNIIVSLAYVLGRTHPVILFRIRTAEASCQKAS